MKKIAIIIVFTLLLFPFTSYAGVTERVWVSTDKDVYLAGDMVWCSVFSVDPNSGKLSSENSVAYVELSSDAGQLVSAKIALVGGRGSGAIQIPLSAPTGNYALVAYTAASRGRGDLVEIVEPSRYTSSGITRGKSSGSVELFVQPSPVTSSTARVSLDNRMSSDATVSVSVIHEDGLLSPSGKTFADFVDTRSIPFEGSSEDKDGETLHGRLFGADASSVMVDMDLLAVAAFPGYAEDVYAGKIAADGTVSFRTGNLYGKRDMVCEIIGLDDSKECRLVMDTPFLGVKVPDIPSLKLSESTREALEMRMKSFGTSLNVGVDTLSEFLPKRGGVFLADELCKRYHLDDFRRFPTIRETLVEITPDLRIRKDIKGKPQIQTVLEGVVRDNTEFSGNMLVMIDGVPVKDIEKLLEFEAMLIGDIVGTPRKVRP